MSWIVCDVCRRRAPVSACSSKRGLELCPHCMLILSCDGSKASRKLEPDIDLIEGLKRRST